MMFCREICDGVNFRGRMDEGFKTMRISLNFITPMIDEKTAAANALLPFMMIRSSRDYPDYTALSRHLAELYGATLCANADRQGKNQILSVSASGIADMYALYNESIVDELCKLLCSVAFDPCLDESGEFNSEGFEIEKRQTLELIDSEFNDKRLYSRTKCIEAMLKNELPCVSRFGSREAVLKLGREELLPAWKKLVSEARIEIMAFGNCEPEKIYDIFSESFKSIKRKSVKSFDTDICPARVSSVKIKKEPLNVVQSKLVMGFRTGISPVSDDIFALRVAVSVLGGTPSSRLFLNVREKMGLCYYCSASIDRALGLMIIDSGIEPSDYEKAKEAILKELEAVKNGEFTDWELNAAKLSLCDSFMSIEDFITGIESWYLYRCFLPKIFTPREVVEKISRVTRDEIVKSVSSITLDTVFLLEGNAKNDEG